MVFILDFTFNTYAQSGDTNPIVFDQFFKNYYMINPASSDSSDRLQLSIGNRSLIGLFEGVNRLYVDGAVRIQHQSPTQFSRIGILVISYNDGAFINRTRAYARYSYSAAIGARSSISAGAAVGIVNYTFLGSQAGGGGSASAVDANFGIWYRRSKLRVGISYQQMVRSVLTPIGQRFELVPYLNFNVIYDIYIGAYVLMTSHVYVKYQSPNYLDVQVAPIFLFHDKFEAGVNLRYKRGVALLFGIKSISIGKGDIRFMGSFLLSTRKLANTFDNAFELTAGYSF